MKLQKFLAFLLSIILCFTVIACSNQENDGETDGITPLLYEVSDEKGNTIWLFGSIHVGDDYFYPLPDYVTEAFDSSDSLAVEFDIVAFEKDLNAQVTAIQQLVYKDGTTIKDNISEEIYNEAKGILEENNIYNAMFDYYIPMMWASLIDNCLLEKTNANAELGIDLHMIELAYEQSKEIIDIESPEFQYGMMANFSAELQ